jgi:hypothetical protein
MLALAGCPAAAYRAQPKKSRLSVATVQREYRRWREENGVPEVLDCGIEFEMGDASGDRRNWLGESRRLPDTGLFGPKLVSQLGSGSS